MDGVDEIFTERERERERERENRTKPNDTDEVLLLSSIINMNINLIEKIYLTASGGPFFKLPLKKFKNKNIFDKKYF